MKNTTTSTTPKLMAIDPAGCRFNSDTPQSPSPSLLGRGHPRPGPPPGSARPGDTQAQGATRTLLLKIDGLVAETGRLKAEQEDVRNQLLAASDERAQLRYLLDQAERRANRAEHDLRATRSRLRKAGNVKIGAPADAAPQFADAEQGFRYLVLTQWARRTLPSEQKARPLPDFVVGKRFLESLARLEGIKEEKVADVVFEIVTGLAPQIPSREVHHLRTGMGGDDPVRVREDGAVAWRASLQVNTPSARRIHYWALPNGQVELARVATHDDFDV